MTRCAIQGIRYSYSDEAAGLLINRPGLIECRDFEETLAVVKEGRADCAVMPLENLIIGEIRSAVKALSESGLKTYESVSLEVRHVLAAVPGTTFESLTEISSHPEAIKQCSDFFSGNRHLKAIEGDDTASSIRNVVESGERHRAAIGSTSAANFYGADILRKNLANDVDNFTTFFLISH
ncbi:MAG: hypothetical protein OEM82_10315 [Acidobacteriota bacterium]|nr:hypothetical protein [Acidobacteriota bacterium]MDH3529087.1 hypothetical protein [Acidobacteriota bacterium]